jgi:gas vesicle protein
MTRNESPQDDEPYVVIADRSSDLGPFLFGAALGAVFALLLAPRAGAETRKVVRNRLRSARESARDAAEGVANTFTQARDELERRIESARAAVSSRSGSLSDAVAAGRSAAREAERDLRSRLDKVSPDESAPPPRPAESDNASPATTEAPGQDSASGPRRAPRGAR